MIAKISLIAAVSDNGIIGHGNTLPWHLSKDLEYFKKKTMGHAIIMGRKTYDSIGKPLPGRTNFVVTRNPDFHPTGVIVCKDMQEAVIEAKETEKDEVFVIGGGQIYEQAMPYADKLYITKIHENIEGDVKFPDYSAFKKELSRKDEEEKGIKFTFLELTR